jgi:soluble lytic murein transglycosylase-like protein
MAYSLNSPSVQAVLPTVRKYSAMYGVPVALVLAVIQKESNFKNGLVSSAGARGLMQLMPKYFSGDLFNMDNNIRQGVKFLAAMIKKYSTLQIALASYNWGPGNMDRALQDGGTYPASVRNNYVAPVLRYFQFWHSSTPPVRSTSLSPLAIALVLAGGYYLIRKK